jgi:hypothetical protein
MPMNDPADYPLGDESKDYCIHCARPDSSMQSYQERLDGFSSFIIQTQGLDAQVARTSAQTLMAKLPAWKTQL